MAGSSLPGPLRGAGPPIDPGTLCRAPTPLPGPAGMPATEPAALPLPAVADSGLTIVLTPIQLAAVLEGETFAPEPTLSNRLWGAATLVGGALELLGAGALLLAPEPTMATKVAGGALGLHGIDTASTGLQQILSGQSETTLTASGAQSAAELLGADAQTAARIGFAADVAIPLIAGGIGAARAIAVRRGAIRLAAEEAAGGHTIARHVGRTEAQLRARLAAQPGISAASTFHTLADAERFVSAAVRANRAAIRAWAQTAQAGQGLTLTHDAGRAVGFGVVRATQQLQTMQRLTVVLRRVQQADRAYFVLTAFPKP